MDGGSNRARYNHLLLQKMAVSKSAHLQLPLNCLNQIKKKLSSPTRKNEVLIPLQLYIEAPVDKLPLAFPCLIPYEAAL